MLKGAGIAISMDGKGAWRDNVSSMRAFCFECGIAIHQGVGKFKLALPQVLADQSNDLTLTMRRLLAGLFEDLQSLEKRIADVTREKRLPLKTIEHDS